MRQNKVQEYYMRETVRCTAQRLRLLHSISQIQLVYMPPHHLKLGIQIPFESFSCVLGRGCGVRACMCIYSGWSQCSFMFTVIDASIVFMAIAGYLFLIYLLKALYYSPFNRTGSPQGFRVQILHKLNTIVNTKRAHYIVNHKLNLKIIPFGIALVKMSN